MELIIAVVGPLLPFIAVVVVIVLLRRIVSLLAAIKQTLDIIAVQVSKDSEG